MSTAVSMTMSSGEFRARKPVIPFVQPDEMRSVPRNEALSDDENEIKERERKLLEEMRSKRQEGDPGAVIDVMEKPSAPRRRSTAESLFWVAACFFILYYGDGKRDFITACLKSPFVIKRPFVVACLCSVINSLIMFYLAVVVRLILRDPRHFDHAAPGAVSAVSLLGVMAYLLYSISLWPVFGGWIIPILWCFFMGMVVVASLFPELENPNPKYLNQKQD